MAVFGGRSETGLPVDGYRSQNLASYLLNLLTFVSHVYFKEIIRAAFSER